MKIFIFVGVFLLSLVIAAQVSFPEADQYRRDLKYPEKDSFCPRLEGSYPAQCCPYLQNTSVQCYYYDVSSVQVGAESSGTTCVNGVNTTTACCDMKAQPCIKNVTQKMFIQRLIKRSYQAKNICGFEACPFPNYWKKDQIEGKQISRTPPYGQCNVVSQTNQCSRNLPSCRSFSSCPVISPTPSDPTSPSIPVTPVTPVVPTEPSSPTLPVPPSNPGRPDPAPRPDPSGDPGLG